MIKRTFDPGFRIELHQKDLNLALQGRARCVACRTPRRAQELFNACAAHGGTAWDHSGMVRALEMMANFEIGGGKRRAAGRSRISGTARPDAGARRERKREPVHQGAARSGRAGGDIRCQVRPLAVRPGRHRAGARHRARRGLARTSRSALKPLGDGFIKLIKMMIAPIVFCVVVHGIAGAGDLKKVGRVGVKALVYFEVDDDDRAAPRRRCSPTRCSPASA